MTNFWNIVHEVIDRSDVLLEILDARLPEMTRNPEVEAKVQSKGKKLILVLNKADLIGQRVAEQEKKRLGKDYPVIFVSTKEHQGTKLLREAILGAANKETVMVGVLGYPNTGKSSIINVLKGRKSASTSSQSGHTKAIQKIRVTNRIMMLDSPGVIPFEEKDELKHVLIGTIMFSDVDAPDVYALEVIKLCNSLNPKIITTFYGIAEDANNADPFVQLEKIAEKRNLRAKGGVLDIERAAKIVIQDWQVGKIKLC